MLHLEVLFSYKKPNKLAAESTLSPSHSFL